MDKWEKLREQLKKELDELRRDDNADEFFVGMKCMLWNVLCDMDELDGDDADTVTIPHAEYDALLRDSEFLEQGGNKSD